MTQRSADLRAGFRDSSITQPPQPNQDLWSAVDRAFEAWLAPEDRALSAATQAAAAAGLPEIAVTPAQGRFLEVLARSISAPHATESAL